MGKGRRSERRGTMSPLLPLVLPNPTMVLSSWRQRKLRQLIVSKRERDLNKRALGLDEVLADRLLKKKKKKKK